MAKFNGNIVKDLISARDNAQGKKANLHIVQIGEKYGVWNDNITESGNPVFKADSVEECNDWYYNRLLGGLVKIG